MCKTYGLSVNEAVKHCIIEHQRHSNVGESGTIDGTTLPTPSVKSGTIDGTIVPSATIHCEGEKTQSSTVCSTIGSTVCSTTSAPYILTINKHNKYILNISGQRLM